jgi:uncharacterized protein (TIGR03437 family)
VRFGLCFVLLLSIPVTWGASRQAVVSYVSVADGAVTNVFAADSAGDLFVVSTGTDLAGNRNFRIVKSDPQGATLAEMDFGGPSDLIVAAAVDPAGDLILAGNTLSPGFPFVQPLFATIHGETGFIVKLDSQLQSILFSTLLTGSSASTLIYALALDAKGNIFVTGDTSDPTFPVTAGAFQIAPPNSGDDYAFVTEISADDKGIVFSTFFGSPGNCGDSTFCLNSDYGVAIVLDSTGNIVIGGYATAGQIPVTPGVYGSSCGDCSDKSTGFLAKFSADGSHLIWATYIPASSGNLQIDIQALALDSKGNVVVVGSSTGPFPVTSGALQTTNPDAIPGGESYAGLVAKFDPLAQKLLFATCFGGQGSVNGVSLDSQGSIWITGSSASNELPVTKDTVLLGTTYVANLSAEGSTVLYIITAPSQAAGQAIVQTNSGSIVALGTAASLLTVTATAGPSIVGIVNSAGSSVSPVVAPKELISIYGIDIGPSPPATAQVNQGVAPSSLEGTTVTFNGGAASLLYVSPTQINAVVPDHIQGESVAMVISTPSGSTPPVVIPVRPSNPQVFSSVAPMLGYIQPAAAVNEDGTVNSISNLAKQGSIVSVWASGAGFITGGQELLLPISVLAIQQTSAEQFISYSMEVLFAGQAPGLIKGLAQINFRLPAGDETGEFQLQAGTALSDPFTIFVDP